MMRIHAGLDFRKGQVVGLAERFDAKLKVVFGGRSKVNMFEMTKLVSKHLS